MVTLTRALRARAACVSTWLGEKHGVFIHLTRCLRTLRARWALVRVRVFRQQNCALSDHCQTLPDLLRAARPSGRFAEGKTPCLTLRSIFTLEAAAPREARAGARQRLAKNAPEGRIYFGLNMRQSDQA